MNNYVDYTRLKTLKDVKRERIRVNKELEYVKYNLGVDYGNFADYFSFDHWKNVVIDKVVGASPTVSMIFSGYDFITSFFRRRKKRHAKRARREEVAQRGFNNCDE